MKAVVVVVAAVAVSGCTNTTCLHGLCHDLDEERRRRGPCVALGSAFPVAFLYGENTEEITTGAVEGYQGEHYSVSTGYAFKSDGNVDRVYRNETWPATSYGFRPDGDIVEHVVNSHIRVGEYDPALFQLAPAVGIERMAPAALLGLIRSIDWSTGQPVVQTYTWDRTPTGWRRTSGAGVIVEYELDDRGRPIAHEGVRYIFDGDLLVEKRAGTSVALYTYDRGGNLVAASYDDGREIAYSYHCWQTR